MACKKAGEAATKSGIAELAKRVPPNQAMKFKEFQMKHAEYHARISRQPDKLPNVDWEYYKRYVRADFVKMVDEFEQKYKGVCEAFDKRHEQDTSNYFVEIDRLKQQVQDEVEKFKAASNERIKALEAKYAQIQALIPYEEMTAEEYAELLPDKSFYHYRGEPSFWPHTPDEQGPGPSIKSAHAHHGNGGSTDGPGGDPASSGGQGGSSSGGSGEAASTSSAAAAKSDKTQSDAAVAQSNTPVSSTEQQRPAANKRDAAKSQNSEEDIACFESRQFKEDLENLKECFIDDSSKAKTKSEDKEAASTKSSKKTENQNPNNIATKNVANMDKLEDVQSDQTKIEPQTTKSSNELSKSPRERECPKRDRQRSDSRSDSKPKHKSDLPNLRRHLEEMTASNRNEPTIVKIDKAELFSNPNVFMPVTPAAVIDIKVKNVTKAAELSTLHVKTAVLEGVQVKVFSPAPVVTKAQVFYPEYDVESQKSPVSNTAGTQKPEKTVYSEYKSVQLLKETEAVVVQISESDATKDLQQQNPKQSAGAFGLRLGSKFKAIASKALSEVTTKAARSSKQRKAAKQMQYSNLEKVQEITENEVSKSEENDLIVAKTLLSQPTLSENIQNARLQVISPSVKSTKAAQAATKAVEPNQSVAKTLKAVAPKLFSPRESLKAKEFNNLKSETIAIRLPPMTASSSIETGKAVESKLVSSNEKAQSTMTETTKVEKLETDFKVPASSLKTTKPTATAKIEMEQTNLKSAKPLDHGSPSIETLKVFKAKADSKVSVDKTPALLDIKASNATTVLRQDAVSKKSIKPAVIAAQENIKPKMQREIKPTNVVIIPPSVVVVSPREKGKSTEETKAKLDLVQADQSNTKSFEARASHVKTLKNLKPYEKLVDTEKTTDYTKSVESTPTATTLLKADSTSLKADAVAKEIFKVISPTVAKTDMTNSKQTTGKAVSAQPVIVSPVKSMIAHKEAKTIELGSPKIVKTQAITKVSPTVEPDSQDIGALKVTKPIMSSPRDKSDSKSSKKAVSTPESVKPFNTKSLLTDVKANAAIEPNKQQIETFKAANAPKEVSPREEPKSFQLISAAVKTFSVEAKSEPNAMKKETVEPPKLVKPEIESLGIATQKREETFIKTESHTAHAMVVTHKTENIEPPKLVKPKVERLGIAIERKGQTFGKSESHTAQAKLPKIVEPPKLVKSKVESFGAAIQTQEKTFESIESQGVTHKPEVIKPPKLVKPNVISLGAANQTQEKTFAKTESQGVTHKLEAIEPPKLVKPTVISLGAATQATQEKTFAKTESQVVTFKPETVESPKHVKSEVESQGLAIPTQKQTSAKNADKLETKDHVLYMTSASTDIFSTKADITKQTTADQAKAPVESESVVKPKIYSPVAVTNPPEKTTPQTELPYVGRIKFDLQIKIDDENVKTVKSVSPKVSPDLAAKDLKANVVKAESTQTEKKLAEASSNEFKSTEPNQKIATVNAISPRIDEKFNPSTITNEKNESEVFKTPAKGSTALAKIQVEAGTPLENKKDRGNIVPGQKPAILNPVGPTDRVIPKKMSTDMRGSSENINTPKFANSKGETTMQPTTETATSHLVNAACGASNTKLDEKIISLSQMDKQAGVLRLRSECTVFNQSTGEVLNKTEPVKPIIQSADSVNYTLVQHNTTKQLDTMTEVAPLKSTATTKIVKPLIASEISSEDAPPSNLKTSNAAVKTSPTTHILTVSPKQQSISSTVNATEAVSSKFKSFEAGKKDVPAPKKQKLIIELLDEVDTSNNKVHTGSPKNQPNQILKSLDFMEIKASDNAASKQTAATAAVPEQRNVKSHSKKVEALKPSITGNIEASKISGSSNIDTVSKAQIEVLKPAEQQTLNTMPSKLETVQPNFKAADTVKSNEHDNSPLVQSQTKATMSVVSTDPQAKLNVSKPIDSVKFQAQTTAYSQKPETVEIIGTQNASTKFNEKPTINSTTVDGTPKRKIKLKILEGHEFDNKVSKPKAKLAEADQLSLTQNIATKNAYQTPPTTGSNYKEAKKVIAAENEPRKSEFIIVSTPLAAKLSAPNKPTANSMIEKAIAAKENLLKQEAIKKSPGSKFILVSAEENPISKTAQKKNASTVVQVIGSSSIKSTQPTLTSEPLKAKPTDTLMQQPLIDNTKKVTPNTAVSVPKYDAKPNESSNIKVYSKQSAEVPNKTSEPTYMTYGNAVVKPSTTSSSDQKTKTTELKDPKMSVQSVASFGETITKEKVDMKIFKARDSDAKEISEKDSMTPTLKDKLVQQLDMTGHQTFNALSVSQDAKALKANVPITGKVIGVTADAPKLVEATKFESISNKNTKQAFSKTTEHISKESKMMAGVIDFKQPIESGVRGKFKSKAESDDVLKVAEMTTDAVAGTEMKKVIRATQSTCPVVEPTKETVLKVATVEVNENKSKAAASTLFKSDTMSVTNTATVADTIPINKNAGDNKHEAAAIKRTPESVDLTPLTDVNIITKNLKPKIDLIKDLKMKAETTTHEDKPTLAILKATDSAALTQPHGAQNNSLNAKVLASSEVVAVKNEENAQTILKSADSAKVFNEPPSSIVQVEVNKNITLQAERQDKESKITTAIETVRPDSERSAGKATAKPLRDNKPMCSSKIVCSDAEAVESVFNDTGCGYMNHAVKGMQMRVLTLSDFSSFSSNFGAFNKKIINSNIEVKPEVELVKTNNGDEAQKVETKAQSSSNAAENASKQAKTSSSTSEEQPQQQSKEAEKSGLKMKIAISTNKDDKPPRGVRATGGNPKSFKGFTLVGLPTDIDTNDDMHTVIAKPGELFESVQTFQDHSNKVKNENSNFSKASKKDETTEEPVKKSKKN